MGIILKGQLILLLIVSEAIAVTFLCINLYTFSMSMFHPEKFGDYGPLYNMFFHSLSIFINLIYIYVIYRVIVHFLGFVRRLEQNC